MSTEHKAEGLDPKPSPPVKEVMTDETSQALHELVDAVKVQSASVETFAREMKAIQETREKTSRFIDGGPSLEADPVEASSLAELVSMEPVNDWHREVCELNDKVYFQHQALKAIRHKKGLAPPRVDECKDWARLKYTLGKSIQFANIWNPATATGGAEWAPTGVSSMRIDPVSIAGPVAASLPRYVVPNGMQALRVPVNVVTLGGTLEAQGSVATAPLAAVDTSATAGNPLTGYMEFIPITYRTPYLVTAVEEVEDATVSVVDALVSAAQYMIRRQLDFAIINGQTADDLGLDVANSPNGYDVANGYATGDKNAGFRVYGIATNANTTDCSNAAFSVALLASGRASMGIYGADPSSLALYGSPKVVYDLIADTRVSPVDSGLQSIRTGTVARVFGIDVIMTEEEPACLATGKVGASANNFTCAQLVYTPWWGVGMKRDMQVKVWPSEGADTINVRGFARHGVSWAGPASSPSADIVAAFINIAP